MKSSEAANLVFQWIFVLNSVKKAQVFSCEYRWAIFHSRKILNRIALFLKTRVYNISLEAEKRSKKFLNRIWRLRCPQNCPREKLPPPPAPPSGSELGLELTLELGLGSNFSSGTIFLEPKTGCKYFSQMVLYYFIGKIFFCRTKEVSLVELPW